MQVLLLALPDPGLAELQTGCPFLVVFLMVGSVKRCLGGLVTLWPAILTSVTGQDFTEVLMFKWAQVLQALTP